jgi:CcmD family protein
MPIALLQATLPPANLPFLFVAFAVTWIAFFAYAFFMSRRQHELSKEIAELRGTLDQQG